MTSLFFCSNVYPIEIFEIQIEGTLTLAHIFRAEKLKLSPHPKRGNQALVPARTPFILEQRRFGGIIVVIKIGKRDKLAALALCRGKVLINGKKKLPRSISSRTELIF